MLLHCFVRQVHPKWLCLPQLKSEEKNSYLGTPNTFVNISYRFFVNIICIDKISKWPFRINLRINNNSLIGIPQGTKAIIMFMTSPDVDMMANTSLPLTSNDTPCTKHLLLLDGGISRPLTCRWGKNSGRPEWKLGAPASKWECERALAALSCIWEPCIWSIRGFRGWGSWREFGIAIEAGLL